MTTQDDPISDVRARLLAEQAQTLEELESLRSRLETKGSYSLGEGDPMIYQWELNLALFKRAEKHLTEIEEALAQIDRGDYGLCDLCKRPIDPERLAVLPYTRLCASCAQPQQRRR